MSRKDEDKILHGLYYYRESIDEEFSVTSDQILWLAAHSYRDATAWAHEGQLRSFDSSIVPAEVRDKLFTSKFELPLRYLQHRRLIKYINAIDDSVVISVTFAGADRAIRLHTWFGRMEAWYQERREGFLGLFTTIAVSIITALLTLFVTDRIRHVATETPRVIYEVVPKSAP